MQNYINSNDSNELDNIRPFNPKNLEVFEQIKKEVNKSNAGQETINDKPAKPHKIMTFAECCNNNTQPKWLIKNIIAEKSFVMIFGKSGSYKGFFIVELMASIACSEISEWNGKKIKEHGDVVYFSYEGAGGVPKRFRGWANDRGINPDNVRLFFDPEPFKLDSKNEGQNIENTIKNIELFTKAPKLIVFDTLNRYLSGDENQAKDAGAMLELFGILINKFNCAVAVVHHTGVSEETQSRGRGSGAWRGAADYEYKVSASPDFNPNSKKVASVAIEQTKNKDGRQEPIMLFDAKEVIVPDWFDDDEPITTCVLNLNQEATEQHQQEIRAAKGKKEKQLTQSEITARETYQTAAMKYGAIITDEATGNEVIYTPTKKWREIFYNNSSVDTTTKEGKKKLQLQFERARKKLKEEKHVLTSTINNGIEFYCLAIQNEIPADIRKYAEEIKNVIEERRENQDDRIKNLI